MSRADLACRFAAVLLLGLVSLAGAAAVKAEEIGEEHATEHQSWPFAGFRGQYDQAQLQRGFQIYQNVCSACHGLKRVRFRNLAEPGGPQFPEASVKALAIGWPNKISGEFDDQGNPIDRLPGLADPILGPFKNDKQARAAQNGALPPDLSLIAKARSLESTAPWYTHWFWMLVDIGRGYQEGGADYVHNLLTGYTDPPAGVTVADGMYYNVTFPGHQLAMPPPLSKDNVVEYQPDAGAKGSLDQNARDIAAFLAWSADPTLDSRKRIGWQVLLYLLVTTLVLYAAKRLVWSGVKH
jgi:ubiquinol-cytochrome c reductase cytochrome c1 subunit